VGEGAGVISIRSVYDIGGGATANSEALADPARTTADQRPARFLRVVKAVSIPDEDIVDLDNTAFGRSTQQGMKEIVGYAPIEPDGSVMVKVPRSEEHTSELQSRENLVCRLLLEKKKKEIA